MKIVVPVTAQFNRAYVDRDRPARTLWLRFDIEDIENGDRVGDPTIEFSRTEPGVRGGAHWWPCDDTLLEFCGDGAWKSFKALVARYPCDYAADEAEGEAAQKLLDEAEDAG